MSPPVKKRAYRSPVRQQQAQLTRSLVVEAAAGLFLEQGYAATTVKAIAARAGVAPDTVYAVFGSKVRVLTAVIDARLAPSGEANVTERPEAQAVRDEPDQRRLVERFARDMATLSTRVRPVVAVLRAAADAELDVREVLTEMERHRLANMRRVVDWMGARGPLRVEPERAAEIIWALASPEVGRLLCDDLGWSEADHAAFLAQQITAALLPDRSNEGSSSPRSDAGAARSGAVGRRKRNG
jgi:AcrR family transcriptional regulator